MWAGVLCGALGAQGAAAPPGKLVGPLEQVAAIVGNEVILHSTIDSQVHGWLRSQVGARIDDPQQIEALYRQILGDSVRRSMLAQTARTLGAYDPDQVEDYVEHAVREREAEEVERSGSYSRFVQQLHEANLSWDLIAAEERTKTLQQFAEQQVAYGLVGARRYLLFTPREMRDYYNDNIEDFTIEARTDVASVAFADAATAEEAAAAWAKEDLAAEQIESRFGGILSQVYSGDRGFPQLAEGEAPPANDDRAAFLWEAAQTQAVGTARSVPVGAGTWVVKVIQRIEGSRREFLDRSVQREIRETLGQRFTTNLRYAAIRRAQRRIHVWAPELGR